MKPPGLFKWAGLIVPIMLALALVGSITGQGPGPDEGVPAPTVTGETNRGSGGRGGPAQPAGANAVSAQPPYTMNYQGYLTDASGNSLNGTYTLTFSLYDAASGGYRVWGPEAHNNVPVSKGLFHVVLGESVTLYPVYFAEALFLDVTVNGTVMSTRQPVRTVAYAFGLAPGANVQGDPIGDDFALTVVNTGTASNDGGLYASGNRYGIRAVGETYGIYAEEVGAGDVGIASPDFVQAMGYKSDGDSYLWVPGMAGFLDPGSLIQIWSNGRGAATIKSSAVGTNTLFLPVTTPSQLYGQEVRVEELSVYYYASDSASYIATTQLYKLSGAGSGEMLINNATDRTSTSPTSYSLTPTGNYTLTASSGPLNVALELNFGSTAHSIYIEAVRLRLGHTD